MSRLSKNIHGDDVEVLTAAKTLTAEDHGKVFFLNSATEFAVTLPAMEAGLKFKFIVKAAPVTDSYTVVTASSANKILGQVASADLTSATVADSETSGGDTISFAAGVAVVGDWAEVVCDGAFWYTTGACKTYNGITITTAS